MQIESNTCKILHQESWDWNGGLNFQTLTGQCELCIRNAIDRNQIGSHYRVHPEEIKNSAKPHRSRLVNLLLLSARSIWRIPRKNLTFVRRWCMRTRIRLRGKFNIPKLHPFDRALYCGGRKSYGGELNTPHKYRSNKFNEFRVYAALLRSREFFTASVAAREGTGF